MSAHIRQTLNDSYNATDLSAFNRKERPIVESLLRQSITDALPFEGKFEADWLLEGSLGDSRWKTKDGNKTQLINGKYERTIDVIFDKMLPDGSQLLDDENSCLLEAIQKSSFLLRCGLLDTSLGPRAWAQSVYWILNLSDWAILHESSLKPKKYGFSLIDQNTINLLYQQLSVNSWAEALEVIPRLTSYFYESATGLALPTEILENSLQLPLETCSRIVEFLRKNEFYSNENPNIVCRKAVANILHLKANALKTTRLSAFLRQFEPNLQHPYLLVKDGAFTEYPSQNTVLKTELANIALTEKSYEEHRAHLHRYLPAYRHLPTLFPDPRSIDVQQALSLSRHQTKPSNHHNLIPLNIGLAYLNESMRWVIVYGDAIIKGVLEMTKNIQRIDSLDDYKAVKLAKKCQAFNKINSNLKTTTFPNVPGQLLSEAINLSCYQRSRQTKSFSILRSAPSLMDALEVLVGACVISIAMLKPSREEEIWSLKRPCAVKQQSSRGEAWWLEFELGKSGQLGVNQETQKPIPYFTAKAINLMQQLGRGLCKLHLDDSAHAKNLFYLPTNAFGKPTGKDIRVRINNCLNRFCDYVNLPTDQYGRRWYVRIHEMRKWFLLMMFWHGRYGVLDAIRWIAGHTDAKHTYAYIEANFPGEELPKLEAQCVDDKLINLERGNLPNEEGGLVGLYHKVCGHFGVTKIEGIRGSEYIEYLEDLRYEDIYHIEPYSILSDDGQAVVGVDIAVKFGEKA